MSFHRGGVEWRRIPNFRGFYVSEQGDIVDDNDEPVPYYRDSNDDYCVILSTDEQGYRGPAWQIMLNCFYKRYRGTIFVDYRDGDDKNVGLDNLIFLINDERIGQMRELRWREVDGYRVLDRRIRPKVMDIESGKVYNSAAEFAAKTGLPVSNVSAALNGRLKSVGGMVIRYV